jgi:Membrane dipeptidase (Peptidase family M19)
VGLDRMPVDCVEAAEPGVNEVGMGVDEARHQCEAGANENQGVSHLSDRGFEDTSWRIAPSRSSPPIRMPARCVANLRNLPDHFITGIAEAGAVIGFHALHALVTEGPEVTLTTFSRTSRVLPRSAASTALRSAPT